MPATDLNLRMKLIPSSDRNGLRQSAAFPCLLGCQAMQGAVRAVFVVPDAESIEPTLNAPGSQASQGQPPPGSKRPECPLDLAVQVGRPRDTPGRGGITALGERVYEVIAPGGDALEWR